MGQLVTQRLCRRSEICGQRPRRVVTWRCGGTCDPNPTSGLWAGGRKKSSPHPELPPPPPQHTHTHTPPHTLGRAHTYRHGWACPHKLTAILLLLHTHIGNNTGRPIRHTQ